MEEKRESYETWQPFAWGLLAGAVVGGVLGLLFAPRAGKETREKIGEFAHNVQERFTGHPVEEHSGSYGQN